MNCPECGMKISENQKKCDFCGHLFIEAMDKKEKPRTVLIHTLGFCLTSLAMLIVSELSTLGTFLAVGFILFYTWTSVKSIRKSKARPIVKGFVIVLSAAQNLWLVFTLLWSVDAAPIQNDYTIADMRSAPSEYNITYELLCGMAEQEGINWPGEKDDMQKEGVSEEEENLAKDIKILLGKQILSYAERLELTKTRAEDINDIWESGETYRYVIHNLNTYEEIADLTEPKIDALMPYVCPLRDLAKIHFLYAPLACEQGEQNKIIVSLIEFDSVVRKFSLNAHSMIGKLVCYTILRINLRTANFIINHPAISCEAASLLAKHFVPIGEELTCLRNSFVHEYLTFTHVIEHDLTQTLGPQRGVRMLLIFKQNSTLRAYRNNLPGFFTEASESSDNTQEDLSVWPEFYPNLGPVRINSEGNFPWYYEYYNKVGSMLIEMLLPAMSRIRDLQTNVLVYDDLLQIVINARLGRKIDLKARAFSDNYIVDIDKNIIYSPGLDQIPFTEDDIQLAINPEVIAF